MNFYQQDKLNFFKYIDTNKHHMDSQNVLNPMFYSLLFQAHSDRACLTSTASQAKSSLPRSSLPTAALRSPRPCHNQCRRIRV